MKAAFLSKKAVTLTEIVVTMVLLAIIVISCFNYYTNILGFSIKAENYNAATNFLTETLEKLSSYAYDDLALSVTDGESLPSDHHDDPLPVSNLRDKYGATRQYTVSRETPWDSSWLDTTFNLYKDITATIKWNDGAAKTLTLSVRKTK